jgi:hypothetical protein
MTHYAKVVNGIVTKVIVADAAFFDTFVDDSPGTWLQTSYNTRGGVHYAPNSNRPDNGVALRGNYAGIGFIYDATHDVFYPPQPHPDWTIAAPTWTWTPPATGGPYFWDEIGERKKQRQG